MSHNHSHNHNSVESNISIAFFLNAIFVVIEIIGGILTNSIAILTDALHDFGDCLSLATAWFLQKKSTKGRDKKYSYGYKRFSLLGSIFLSGILTFSSLFVLFEAIKRIANPHEVNAKGMLWMAVLGIIINGAAALKVKKGSSLNERSVYLHIMEDVLGWVGVLIVSIVMMFANFPILDPILSIIISIWVLSNVYKNLRSVFKILLQGVPDNISSIEIIQKIEAINGIISTHDVHIWSLDGESHVMTLHIVTNSPNKEKLKEKIINIALEYNINHITIEFEGG
jgi:cation diffusion facilitator family transporter